MKKRTTVGILILAFIVIMLSGCRIGDKEYIFDTGMISQSTIFKINGEKCSVKQAYIYLCNYKNLYGHVYGVDLWEQDFKEEELEQYVKDVAIAELAQIVCMDLLAKEQGISLTKEEKQLAQKAAEEYFSTLTKVEKEFMDIRQKDIEQAYKDYALAQKLYATLTQGVNEEVSDDEARVIRVQQIFVSNRSFADTIEEKLNNGEDFLTVAGIYNELPLVETTVSRGVYPKNVEDIAFNLDIGSYSGMMETEDGYYFIKCLNNYEKALTEANKGNILLQREKEQFDDIYNEFVATSTFELNERLWDSVVLEDEENIKTDSFFDIYNKYFE